jgi:hypothetical protein
MTDRTSVQIAQLQGWIGGQLIVYFLTQLIGSQLEE